MTEKIDLPKLFEKIAHTDILAEQREKNEILKGRLSEKELLQRRKVAIGLAAASLTNPEKSGYMSREGHVFNVFQYVDSFSRSAQVLDTIPPYNREMRLPHLENVLKFNHALKGLIDNDPSLGFASTHFLLRQLYGALNGQEGAASFSEHARARLVGMRHEIGFEQILGTMPDIEYEEGDEMSDLAGADVDVLFRGNWIPLDIKASEATAQAARSKAAESRRNPNLIVWSQLNESDFGDNLRVSHAVAQERAPDVYRLLEQATRSQKTA